MLSRSIKTIVFLLATAAGAATAQDLRLETLELEGGGRIERQVRDVDGAVQPHGTYKRWFANGRVAAEGGYRDGLLQGDFHSFYEDGEPRTVGAFNKGGRSGKWELFHSNGQLAGVGQYQLGMRDRRWVYFDAAGAKLEDRSGIYRREFENYENRSRRFQQETLDDVPHGRFESFWENGQPQLAGEFRHGVRVGWWSFQHMDGSLEPEWITGVYVDGQRVGGDLAAAPADPFLLLEELQDREFPEPEPRQLPKVKRLPGVKSQQRVQIEGWVDLFHSGTEIERQKAEMILVQYGRDALPEALNGLAGLDPAVPEESAIAQALNSRVLRAAVRGRGWEWSQGEDEAALLANRRCVLRWFSWWELAKDDELWWQALPDLAPTDDPELLNMRLFDPRVTVPAPPGETPAVIEFKRAKLFDTRQKGLRDSDARKAIENALDWLAAHQSKDGGWSSAHFRESCGRRGKGDCDGPGDPLHDIGVSSLALLAFMGAGHTAGDGDHAASVARGLTWLLSRQDEETGVFGDRHHTTVYGHALATLVLSEALHFTDAPEVRTAAERAVEVVLAARNPDGAWRYDMPPTGDNDTSISAWMLTALAAAREVGIAVDDEPFDEALAWMASVTTEENGRVGYDAKGSFSARVASLNDQYSPTQCESMTAAAMWCRQLTGATLRTDRLLEVQAELVLAHPPDWRPKEFVGDVYGWWWGSLALRRMGDRAWSSWWDELKVAALQTQNDDKRSDLYGSCDPLGVWGMVGGRVYSTALVALCLENEFRVPDPKLAPLTASDRSWVSRC